MLHNLVRNRFGERPRERHIGIREDNIKTIACGLNFRNTLLSGDIYLR